MTRMLLPILMTLLVCACGGDGSSSDSRQPDRKAPPPTPEPQKVRLVYATQDENAVSNLYVHDLTQTRAATSFTTSSTTAMGFVRLSKNGSRVVFQETSGQRFTPSFRVERFWSFPTDGSSPARAFTPDLQPSDVLDLYSDVSPDGSWIVYGIFNLSGDNYYLADLRTGTSTPIPPPAGTTARSKGPQVLFFGASSQYFYFSALDPLGWAPYRAPVSNPAAAERLSQPTTTPRDTYAYLVSQDESRILQSSWENGIGWLELMELAYPEKPKKLSPQDMQSPDDVFTYIGGNASLSRVVFLTARMSGTESNFNVADTAQAGSGKFIATLDSVLFTNMDLSESASSLLASNTRSTGNGEFALDWVEVNLNAGTLRTYQSAPITSGGNGVWPIARYVDRELAIAYSNESGLEIVPRNGTSAKERIFTKPVGTFDVSPDSKTFGILARPAANEPYQLWVAVRGQGPARQLTGLDGAKGSVWWAQVVPAE